MEHLIGRSTRQDGVAAVTRPNLRRRLLRWSAFARLWLCLGWLIAVSPSVLAEEEASRQPDQKTARSGRPNDPLSLVEGSADSWSVLDNETGCYLLSAYRKGSSRLAIGRHPVFGLGLFAIGLGLSTPSGNATETVSIQINQGALVRQGRIAANMLLFVALDPSALQASLQELENAGMLWITVRKAAIAHGGKEAGPAIAQYRRRCDAAHPS